LLHPKVDKSVLDNALAVLNSLTDLGEEEEAEEEDSQ